MTRNDPALERPMDADLPERQRAGVRISRDTEPTGVFVVVEMTILVIVTALAMVAIIVASGDDTAGGRSGYTLNRGERAQTDRTRARLDDLRSRSTERERLIVDLASR